MIIYVCISRQGMEAVKGTLYINFLQKNNMEFINRLCIPMCTYIVGRGGVTNFNRHLLVEKSFLSFSDININ
jgi:hypothetical protein